MHGDEVCAFVEATTLYHGNQQYSVTALSDSSGNVSERYAYTAYGQPTFLNASGAVQTSSAASNRYTYTGREWDSTLGLYHFRARWMSGMTGRFLTRDPITYNGSDWNLYELFAAVPFVNMDPMGLKCTRTKTTVKPDGILKMDLFDRFVSGWGNITKGILPFELYSTMSTEYSRTVDTCDSDCCAEPLVKSDTNGKLKFTFGGRAGAITPIMGVPVMFVGSFEFSGGITAHAILTEGGCRQKTASVCFSANGSASGKICASPPGRVWRKLISVCVLVEGGCTGGGCFVAGSEHMGFGDNVPNVSKCEIKVAVEACGFFVCTQKEAFRCDTDSGCTSPMLSHFR
jgi:RHS repeat-associated protein